MSEGVYEVFAIKYAAREARASEHFYGRSDPHEDGSMPMDYFIWVAKSNTHTVVIDAGFTEAVAARRKRDFLRCPIETLGSLDIKAEDVKHVIVTHMHYDHIGNLEKFPDAQFILQEAEMMFWAGKNASRKEFRKLVEAEDVLHLVKENLEGRVDFVSGIKEIVPGITVYGTGGHSAGLQFVKVQTVEGNVILMSDVSHFYANFEQERPYPIIHDLSKMYEAFDLVRSVSDEATIRVPGHDPKVMERFPAPSPELEGIIVRIS
ncbi:N-acyl homoserine lactonase family protein [Planococcus soli]|uniref:N-acyl homoserine lactonase family protein n=1 Tax=Planococcus soli TaxID=2666072 RepID=UPI00115C54E3|nr:N-acyl homoserine lactonase family protein [Planococcus soli]